MQITKINNTIVVEIKSNLETPKILNSIKFFDRFNIELYNRIKQIKNVTPVSNRIEK